MSAEPTAPGLEDFRQALHAALRAGDDHGAILAASQMLGCPDIALDDRRNVLCIRAKARARVSHFAAAADDWTRMLEAGGAPEAVAARGACLFKLGDFQAALDDFLAAGELSAPDVSDRIWRGACRYHLGDVGGARSEFREACALEPDNASAWGWRAVLAEPQDGDFEASLDEIDRVIEVLPLQWTHRYCRARLLAALGRRAEALRELDAVLAHTADERDVRALRAELREATGDADGAVADLQVLALSPKGFSTDRLALIELLRRLGRAEAALAATDACDADGTRGRGLNGARGEILRDLGRSGEAIDAFRAELEASPWDRACGLALAGLLRANGDLGGAAAVLERLDRQYSSADVAPMLAEVLHALGRPREALACLDRAIAAKPDDAAALLSRALIREAVGRIREAREDRERARRLQHPSAQLSRAR